MQAFAQMVTYLYLVHIWNRYMIMQQFRFHNNFGTVPWIRRRSTVYWESSAKKKFANFTNLKAFVNVFLHFLILAGIFIYEITWIMKAFSWTMVKKVIRETFLQRMIPDIRYLRQIQVVERTQANKKVRKWSKGYQFIIEGEGHIEAFTPLYLWVDHESLCPHAYIYHLVSYQNTLCTDTKDLKF